MASHPQQFIGSRLKIQRAYRHIQEIEATFRAFLHSDFCQLVVEAEPNTGNQLVKLVSVGAPPPEMSLMIGDAVHNLRSALDHAMVQILGKRGERAAFPVAKERNNPGAHSTYGLIAKALPELAKLLTDKIQIHDTGDVSLWAISALDNVDKHNLLITVASVQALRGVSLEDKTRNNRFTNMDLFVGQGGVLHAIHYGGTNLEVTSKGSPAAQILFGKGQPLEGKPVINSLQKMAELTLQAIQALEPFGLGQKPKG